jgi:hypothetical protein
MNNVLYCLLYTASLMRAGQGIGAGVAGVASASTAAAAHAAAAKEGPFESLRLMAMSSVNNTFVVSIHPDVKVIYKWTR